MRWIALGMLLALGCGDDVFIIDARDDAALLPDAGSLDSGPDATPDAGVDGAMPALHPAYYPDDQDQSPITPFVVENLRSIRARATDLRGDVFAKVGDSITVSDQFMHCLAGAVDLDGRDVLQPTIDHFLAGDADGSTPFTRTSLSATVSWTASRALEGSPSPLEREVEAVLPGYALVMFGTNDVGFVALEDYAETMLDITDELLDRGVVPILSSIPPRGDDAMVNANVPRFNMAVRAMAQARQIPFVDWHRALLGLPSQGLGGDGVHPNVGGSSACDFSAAGLQFGYNMRNLVTLQALSRALGAIDSATAPDAPGPALVGDGSPADPFVIDRLPFTHVANTTFSDHRNLSTYTGCAADQNESGPEYLYRLELDRAVSLWLRVLDRGSVDVDIHLLDAPNEAGCTQRAHREIEVDLGPGTYYLALDTFVGSGGEASGEYLLVVMER